MNFEHLANQHKDAVYRQMIRVCGNHEDAEDVLIDALLSAWRNMEQLREPDAFRAWLAQIARRICWQLRRRESLAPLLQLSELSDEPTSAETPVDQQVALAEMKQLLNEALAHLSEQSREVFRLRDLEEVPGEEVARRLGISMAAMKSRLHRARTAVREFLDAQLSSRVNRTEIEN